MDYNLSNLKQISLRKVWQHEEKDFSQWLSQDENLSILGEEIGIDIELIETEASVGNYRVDMLAEESETGKKIVIENQLESTDHDHLGKIITYSSGLDAEVIIWVVKDLREEHRQAVDWLNEHTDSNLNIFVAKIELWQIDDSPIAPKFQILSRPNDWKNIVKDTKKQELSKTKLQQLKFWEKFREFVQDNNYKLSTGFTPRPRMWYNIRLGTTKCHISVKVNTLKDYISCEIYIPHDEDFYEKLYDKKNEIEDNLDSKLEWQKLPNKKASRIIIKNDGNIFNEDKWDDYFKWLADKAEIFQKVFSEYI